VNIITSRTRTNAISVICWRFFFQWCI